MEINKLYNEDACITMSNMPDDFIDLTITSPPYDNIRQYLGYSFDFEHIAHELYRVTKQGGVVVWVVNDATIDGSETGTSFKQALYFKEIGFNLHDTMIWEKHTIPQTGNRYEPAFEYMFILSKGKPKTFNPIMVKKLYADGRNAHSYQRDKDGKAHIGGASRVYDKIDYNIWKISVGGGIVTEDSIAYQHPAIFPEELVSRHIYSWSNENDLIYDPFAGSGTVLKMCILMNRKYIGSEISNEYSILAGKRILPYKTQMDMFFD